MTTEKYGVKRRVVHQWFSARKKKAKSGQEVASEAGDIGARKEDKEQEDVLVLDVEVEVEGHSGVGAEEGRVEVCFEVKVKEEIEVAMLGEDFKQRTKSGTQPAVR